MDSLKEMYLSAGIDQDVYDFCDRIQKGLKDRFEKIDQTAEYNQMKVNLLPDMATMILEEKSLKQFMQMFLEQKLLWYVRRSHVVHML